MGLSGVGDVAGERGADAALAEAAFGALNARDLDGFIAVAAEDVEFTSLVAEMRGNRAFRGHDGHARMWWETVVDGVRRRALGGR